ncbi:MAG: cytochrome c [Wenzhouxiangella sp.]|jgi:cytochrome c556|nr:cytochrome c [Wenzhouxiangella sp.]
MNRIKLAALSAVALGLAATAIAQPSVEDQIKARQSAYTFMSWNMGQIKAQVVDKEVEFNADQVQAWANAIAAAANSGMSAMYSPASVEGTGWKPTRLDPKFFDELDQVGEIAGNFVREANALAEVAQTGNIEAIAEQFKATGESCGACHRNYRTD